MSKDLIFNTYEQLKAAGEGIAFSPRYIGIRETHVYGWEVWRVGPAGVEHFKRKFDVDLKLPFHQRQAAALAEAQQWAATTLGERGPWSRNRMGDVLPTRIHKRFPLRSRRKETL